MLDFLNDTLVKTLLLLLGGFVLKKWEPFVNKAIPVALLVLSAILRTLQAMFPGVGDANASAFMFAGVEVATKGRWSWVWDTLVPVAFAIASQSGAKNTVEWIKTGVGLFWPYGRAPKEKPLS